MLPKAKLRQIFKWKKYIHFIHNVKCTVMFILHRMAGQGPQFFNSRPMANVHPIQSTPVPRFLPGYTSGTQQRLADLQQAGVTMQRIVATTGKLHVYKAQMKNAKDHFLRTHFCYYWKFLWMATKIRGDILPQLQNIPSLWPGSARYYNELIIYGSMHTAGPGQKNICEFC